MQNLNSKEKELVSHIEKLVPKDGHIAFDFNDPKQYEFAKMIAEKNFGSDRYPGMMHALELQKKAQTTGNYEASIQADDDAFSDKFAVTGIGQDAGQTGLATNGVGTLAGGFESMALTMWITDNNTGKIIANGSQNSLNGTVLGVDTTPVSHSGTDVTSYLSYSATPSGGGTPSSGIVQLSAYNAAGDPTVTQPVMYCTNPWVPGAINIGLGRAWTDSQLGVKFDYAWNEQTSSSPVGKIPFVGSVIFTQNIQPLEKTQNFLLQISVADDTRGGVVTLPATNLDNVYDNFSIDGTNPKQLNWSLPAGTSTTDPGNPVTFGNITWPSDMKAIFFCQIIVTLEDGSFGSANVQSELNAADTDPLDGTKVIPPISFVWHCLGEDTKVSMADGSTKQIADVITGDEVITDIKGNIASVTFTNKGAHYGSAMHITAANGATLIASDNHLIMTKRGPVLAEDLNEGDVLFIEGEGEVPVAKVVEISDYEGMFYNLGLETKEPSEIKTFLANAITVGDAFSQRALKLVHENDVNHVKAHISEHFHKDADSLFEDRAKQEAK